jgi:PAS domain S-box-containing protein
MSRSLKPGKIDVLGLNSVRQDGCQMMNEELYHFLVEKAGDGIAIVRNSRFEFVNSRLRKMLGYTMEDLYRLPVTAVLSPPDVDRLKRLNGHRDNGDNGPELLEAEVKHKDGWTICAEICSGPISHNGNSADLVIFRDITARKRSDEKLRRTVEKLRQVMGASIQAITLTVELKDPFTAGHQRRVADLSRAIAEELGLSGERIEAIRMASSIHDLGKVAIPSEILIKPGSLSETEISLIKTHPRVGYDILKQIEFPWPIARIVLEHHERLDGSGYPQGLKGEEIMLEARIVGVADVIEAMVSRRPYREAFNLWKALEEVKEHSGILYDADAVTACLKLFNAKGYTFK